MVELLGALAVPVGKLLLKAKLGAEAAEVGGSLLTLASKRLGDWRKAKEAEGRAVAIGEAVVADLGRLVRAERGQEDDLAAAAGFLGETIENHVDAVLLIEGGLDDAGIGRAILAAFPVDDVFRPAEPANRYYRQLVTVLAPGLRKIAAELPGYTVERDAAFLARLDELSRTAPEVLARVERIGERLRAAEERRRDDMAWYERAYLDALKRDVGQLTLFGVDPSPERPTPRDLPLSIAYIPLRLRLAGNAGGSATALDFPELLAALPLLGDRLLIEGAAGSGKSTLLQWTAHEALLVGSSAKPPPRRLDSLLEHRADLRDLLVDDRSSARTAAGVKADEIGHRRLAEAGAWHERTPFLVRLRHCHGGRMPEPADFPGLITRGIGAPPEDWVRQRLRDGGALVLFDGIDEVPDAQRDAMRESIEDYFEHYSRAQFIVTGRPAALLDPAWDELFGRSRVAVQPMAPVDVEDFVEQWHRALAEAAGTAFDPRVVGRLAGEIAGSPGLRQLATTPLLCAVVCYLHHARQGELPRRLNALYEELCKLLIHRLDEARFKREGHERLSRALAGLDFEDKHALLARLAHYMVREEEAALDAGRAAGQVREGLERLRKLDGREPAAVLDALQERSGVLRGRSPDTVEFAHNGLRSHLAATLFRGDASCRDLIGKALATADPDLPVLAAAQGDDGYRDRLVAELLRRAWGERDADTRRALLIMAARCGVSGIGSADLRKELERVEAEVMPPENLTEAGQLADLGPRVVPALARRPDQPVGTAAASVHCLGVIGGNDARRLIDAYLDHEDEEVADALAQVTAPMRVKAIAQAVLQPEYLGKGFGPLRHIKAEDVAEIDGHVEVLNLTGARLSGADPLRGFKSLRHLSLDGTRVTDLAPLADLAGLMGLWLGDTRVTDLAPLAGLAGLTRLSLTGTPVADLAPLAGLAGLTWLSLAGTSVTDLAPLAGLAGLTDLSLAGTPVTDLAPLAGLAELTVLWLNRTRVTCLAPLAGLAGLTVLSLDDTPVTCLAPLAGLAGLTELRLDGTPVTCLAPLAGLARLTRLSLDGTRVTDLAPLAGLAGLRELWLQSTRVDEKNATIAALSQRRIQVFL